MNQAKITVEGKVQMVGYRYYALRNAQRLGIRGYVRNLVSGEVEVVARAEKKLLEKFIQIVKKGPQAALISDVKIDYNPVINEDFLDFNVRY